MAYAFGMTIRNSR